jgi:hypothetical protein
MCQELWRSEGRMDRILFETLIVTAMQRDLPEKKLLPNL